MRPPRIWIWCRFSAAFSVSSPLQGGPVPSNAVPRKCITYLLLSALVRNTAHRSGDTRQPYWWYDSNIRRLMYDQRRTRIWIFSTHWGMMNSQETGAHICTAVSVLSLGRKLVSLCPLNRVSCRAVNGISRIYHNACSRWRPQQAVW